MQSDERENLDSRLKLITENIKPRKRKSTTVTSLREKLPVGIKNVESGELEVRARQKKAGNEYHAHDRAQYAQFDYPGTFEIQPFDQVPPEEGSSSACGHGYGSCEQSTGQKRDIFCFVFAVEKPKPRGKGSPIKMAAKLALMLNSFSMSFGIKAAKPEIKKPSLAPAKFRKLKVGLTIKSLKARGISRSLRKASNWLFP